MGKYVSATTTSIEKHDYYIGICKPDSVTVIYYSHDDDLPCKCKFLNNPPNFEHLVTCLIATQMNKAVRQLRTIFRYNLVKQRSSCRWSSR